MDYNRNRYTEERTKMNTWDEERCCESQVLALTAEIVQAEKLNPNTTFKSFSAYGQNIEN